MRVVISLYGAGKHSFASRGDVDSAEVEYLSAELLGNAALIPVPVGMMWALAQIHAVLEDDGTTEVHIPRMLVKADVRNLPEPGEVSEAGRRLLELFRAGYRLATEKNFVNDMVVQAY